MVETIKEGCVISYFLFAGLNNGDSVETYMHDFTPDLVNGNLTIEQWLMNADAVRDKALLPKKQEVYGKVTENQEPMQAAYVNGLIYLNQMNADIAYVPVAPPFGIQTAYYSGDINSDFITLVTTENAFRVSNLEDKEWTYIVAEMTGQQLMDLIVSTCDNVMAGLAGAEVVYSRSKQGAEHYVSIKIDGKILT